jgi:hypothetical protein
MRLPPLLVILLLLPAESPADLIQFEFSGVIVNPAPIPGLVEGDPFTGRLTYDLAPTFVTTAFLWEAPYDPSIGIDITVRDQFFSSDDADIFLIDVEQGDSDYFFTASIPDTPLSLFLSDSSRTAFDSNDLPTSLALEDFDQAHIGQVFLGPRGDASFLIIGTVQSLVQIPEPASGALALVGLLVLALGRRAGPSPR